MPMKKRLDELLLDKELAASLTEAKALIMSGKVIVNNQRVDKASQTFSVDVAVRVKQAPEFVSRSGSKLSKAIKRHRLEDRFRDGFVLDVGSSTGGFTDCCLQLGAEKVYCVDVGTNQLDWKIRQNERVEVFEQTHIEKFNINNLDKNVVFDAVVVDISFNSLVRLSSAILRQPSNEQTLYLLLVKPQFELSSNLVGDNGIVTSQKNQQLACELVSTHFNKKLGRQGVIVASEILGRSGNQEFFLIYK